MTAPAPVILLDIGASLIEGPPKAPARFVAAALGLDEAQRKRLDRCLLTTAIESPADLAELLVGEFQAGRPEAERAAADVWETQVTGPSVIEGAGALLSALRDRGLRYGFVSNIWHPYAASFKRLFGPLAHSGLTVLSYRVGVAKPDPAIYRHALAAAGCPPENCTMIGDSYDNDMAPALALGMKTVWLMHRPDKERTYRHGVESGELPRPDLIVPSIAALTVDDAGVSSASLTVR
ncbi:HAD family hydrolase [Azospirillum isscasi]|uniref:HAD family hydrolase n=1 Tax=Azospirillum isscasi TaxID=3053926 RepID=A0ABU0WH79_9PROT|nr:HAD family hydrolase [Azospirillum isscasi]MDQ2103576.1 HAD family hydrolase [Azospirillum isscasi]